MSMLLVALQSCLAFIRSWRCWALPTQRLLFGLQIVPIDPSLVPSDDLRHEGWVTHGTLMEILIDFGTEFLLIEGQKPGYELCSNAVHIQIRLYRWHCTKSCDCQVRVRGAPSNCYGVTRKGKEMFYLTTHSTHFIYGYLASDIWLRTILIVRKETRCRYRYSFQLPARVLLYAPSHRQDNTYHSLCYSTRGALAGTRNISMGPPHEGSSDDPLHHERTLLPRS